MPPNLDTLNAINANPDIKHKAKFVTCDLNNLDSVRGLFQKALDEMGHIDVLVNCAGIQRRSPSLDFLETDWDDVRPRYGPIPVLYFSYSGKITLSFNLRTCCAYLICLPTYSPLLRRFWMSISSPSGSFRKRPVATWFQGGKEERSSTFAPSSRSKAVSRSQRTRRPKAP